MQPRVFILTRTCIQVWGGAHARVCALVHVEARSQHAVFCSITFHFNFRQPLHEPGAQQLIKTSQSATPHLCLHLTNTHHNGFL